MATVGWTSPLTNRLLLEARGGFRGENYKYNAIAADDPAETPDHGHRTGSVNGAPAGLQYHGGGIGGATATQPYQNTYGRNIDVAVLGVVRHRHARGQDRLQRHDRAARRVARRQQLPRQLPLQQRRSRTRSPQRTTPYQKAQRQPAGIGLTRRTAGRSTG